LASGSAHPQIATDSAPPGAGVVRGTVPNRELLARLAVRPVVVATSPTERAGVPAFTRGDAGELLTTRLRIRPLADTDAAGFLDAVRVSRESVERYMPIFETGEDEAAMFARQLRAAAEGDQRGHAWRRIIELRAPGSGNPIAGVINLNAIQRGMAFEADLALWIRSDLHGAGLGLEATRAVLAFATADLPEGLGLHRVHAGVAPANAACAAMAIRAGFRRDAGKQSMLRVGERWERHDFYVYEPGL
jgi:RimJ/RimL family protein N-acetyltransferase